MKIFQYGICAFWRWMEKKEKSDILETFFSLSESEIAFFVCCKVSWPVNAGLVINVHKHCRIPWKKR